MLEDKENTMKKLLTITLLLALPFTATFAKNGTVSQAAKLDIRKACNPNKTPAELLKIAKKFNPTAKRLQIEFMRFKVANSKAIKETEKALKAGKKEVALLKKKKYTLTSVKDAAWRTCVFAIRPLQLHRQAKKTTRLAIPGMGFKY